MKQENKSFLKNWLDLVRNGIMKLVKINFIMESPLKTIKEILKELNPPEGKGDWYTIEGIWTLGRVRIKDNKAQSDFNSMVVVKLFKNKKTGEIKTYLAKNLDTPERESL